MAPPISAGRSSVLVEDFAIVLEEDSIILLTPINCHLKAMGNAIFVVLCRRPSQYVLSMQAGSVYSILILTGSRRFHVFWRFFLRRTANVHAWTAHKTKKLKISVRTIWGSSLPFSCRRLCKSYRNRHLPIWLIDLGPREQGLRFSRISQPAWGIDQFSFWEGDKFHVWT